VNDEDAGRKRGEEEVQEDLELHDEDASQAVGGATADGSLDAGLHFKYDIKGQKEG
jgi:hypothetical protein